MPAIIPTGTMSEEAMAAPPAGGPLPGADDPLQDRPADRAIDALTAPCRDCRGAGTIPLLVRRVACTTCAGTGRNLPAAEPTDPAAREAAPAHSS